MCHFIPLDGFGCHNLIQSRPVHDVSMELMIISEVESHVTCLHFCKYGTEDTCNFINFVPDTKTCTLGNVPLGTEMNLKLDPNTPVERITCLEVGEQVVMPY